MSNVKIKKELFQTMNIPFLEVVHGYIGSIKIKMQMPMFYKYPIDVFIEKVFFHARQKNINEINKEEEIKNMEAYKLSTLQNQEILKSQINQIEKEESAGMQKQIMSNLRIEIKDVVFRYDDNVSYKKIPYSLGLILKQLSLLSTKSDFKKLDNPDEVLKYEEISYKKICMEDLSLFWDCFSDEDELKFNNLIENSYYNMLDSQLKGYLGEQLDFYVYCLSEIYVHSKNDKIHQYILHNIDMKLNATINDNINKNLKPEYIGDLDFPIVVIDISLKQIETILKVLSYMNLSSLYHEGLAKDFYKKELNENDKKLYIKEYVEYFHKKYEEQQQIEFPEKLKKIEEGISLYQIQLMRAASLKKSGFFKEKALLENKLKEQEGKFFFRNEKLIQSLKKELSMLKESEENYNQIQLNELENKNAEVAIDNLMNLPDTYLHFVGIFHMNKIKFIIHEKVLKIDKAWIYKGKIIEIEFINYFLKGEFFKKGMLIKMSLEDTLIKQDKINNPNYSAILFGDVNTKGKILDIEFEMNPNLERSDMRFTMKAERGIYIICDLYVIQYIQYKVMKVLSTSINFNEIANYAKDSVSQYIQLEYANNFLKGNYGHSNIYLDIVFNSPIIILPLNIFDNNNTNCIKLSLGKFIGTSILPPRMKKEIDYKIIKDEEQLFDIYKFEMLGGKMSTTYGCTFDNGYNGREEYLLKEFDLSVVCKILIETKNPYFSNVQVLIGIPSFDFQIDEFQILFLIDYLGNMNLGNNKLAQETSSDSNVQKEEKKEIEKFMKRLSGEIKEETPVVEDENMKYIRKRMEEFDTKVKKMQQANRYQRFVLSYSQVFNNHRIINSFEQIKKNKKTLQVLLDFKEFKFTIKKNYTDFTTEEYLIYDQKSFEIEYFIDEDGNMAVSLGIKNIGLFDTDKEEIQKISLEEDEGENQDDIINTNNIINTNTKKVIKKNVIEKNFSCLIQSHLEKEEKEKENIIKLEDNKNEEQKESFIIIKYLYKVKLQDTLIEIIMNNLNITISFDSLKRMYQFSMYYLAQYQKMLDDTNNKVPNQNVVLPNNKDDYLNKIKEGIRKKNKDKTVQTFSKGLKSDLQKQLNTYIEKLKSNQIGIVEDSFNKWKKKLYDEKSGKILKRENIKNTMKVSFTMKNTNFKVPLYPKNKDTPLVSFFFNMKYNQDWTNIYENLYTIPNKKIVETNYSVQDSKMNLIVNQLNLNVIFPSEKSLLMGPLINTSKILNDLRIFVKVSMGIIPKLEQSLINTTVILEPLLINLSVKQFIYIWDFYSLAMKFLYYDMAEHYIPLMKPEYLKSGIPKRRKMNLRQCLRRIVAAKKYQKTLKNQLHTIKKEKGEKIENVNTVNFNSHIECDVKIDQIGFIFYDNNDFRKMPLFNADFSNIIVKFISNSKSKDKKNMGNAIVEMISAIETPIEEYNKNSLGMYLNVYFTFEANYHNTNLSEFEPLIERMNCKVLMYQVASFMRSKLLVDVNEMINFNISSNAVKSLNLFLLIYSEQNEAMNAFKKSLMPKNKKSSKNNIIINNNLNNNNLQNKPFSKRPFPMFNRKRMVVNNEGAVVSIFNHTGVNLHFSFESNPENIIFMKPGELMAFSKADLKMARGIKKGGIKKNMNTMSVSILNSGIIHGINFNHNNACQYKLKIEKDKKIYTIYFSVKVKTQGVVKKIIFTSSLSVFNNTNYESIFIMINNKNIERNCIEIPKERRRYIPITWFLTETPESEIRMKFGNDDEEHLVFYHINEFMVDPIDKKKEEENMKMKANVIKRHENTTNLEKKDIIEKIKRDAKNLKNSKIIELKNINSNSNQMQYISLDYYIYQSKTHSKILTLEHENKYAYKRKDTYLSEKINLKSNELEFSYEYFVYVNPSITFFNSLPFDLDVSINDFIKFKLEKNKSENTYYINPEKLNDNGLSIKLILNMYEKRYKSDYHVLKDDLEEIELTEDGNINSDEKKIFNMLKLPKEIELDADIKFTLQLKGFSCKSYIMTFYSDYIINNRLPYTLWCIPCNKKGFSGLKKDIIGTLQKKLPENSLNFITLPYNEDKFIIRSENSQWSKPFDINAIGVNGSITIDSEVENVQKKVTSKSKDIACLISKSQKYKKSTVIVFEERFLLYNHLGFDIYYKQEDDKEIEIKNQTGKELFYQGKKKIYRLGLINSDINIFSYSQPFSPDNVNDVDLLIKIGKKDLEKYKRFKNNIFTNNNKDNFILIRIINKTYDDGTFYLLILLPVFPFMEINNETDEPILINETEDIKDSLVIEPHLKRSRFPFVWNTTYEPKDNLYFQLNNSWNSFSFSKLEKRIITTTNKDSGQKRYYKFKLYRKNKGMTRQLKLVEIPEDKAMENKFFDKIFFLKSKRPSSSSYVVHLNGIGMSIINNTPKELFYISFYDLKIKYISNFLKTDFGTKTQTTENIELYMKNFQIDYCLNDSIKNIIFPSNQMTPTKEAELEANGERNVIEEFVPFLSMLVTRQNFKNDKKNESISFYRQIDLVIQEFNIKVEQYVVTCLLELINEIMGFFDYSTKLDDIKKEKEEVEKILETKIEVPLEKLLKENEDLERMTINILMLGCLKFNVTLRLDLSELNLLSMPKSIKRILGSVGNTLTRITDSKLKFNEKIFTNIYKNSNEIMWELIKHYSSQGIKQIYKILGSTDLFGNPVNFIEGLGTGFFELVNEPRKGFLLGPKQFGKGLLKGLGGVFSGVVGGTVGVVQKVSGTFYSATQTIMGKGREFIIEEEDEPTNIITGIGQGIYGGLKELASGITGIFMYPYKKYQEKKTVTSVLKAIGKGFLGLIISPFAAIFKIVYSISAGTKNTINTITGKTVLVTTRFRHPRVMLGGDDPIHRYDPTLAEAKELLFRLLETETDSVFYAKYFISGDKGFDSKIKEGIFKMCMVVVTDMLIVVIYNSSKVIFKLEINKINNCSVHFIDNKYLLSFRLDDGHIKGFRLDTRYANVACQIHDMFSEMGITKSIKAVYTFKRPEIKNDEDKKQEEEKENEEEKLDKSSYENTLVEDDSVITFDSDKIKIKDSFGLNDLGNNMKNFNEIQTNSSRNQIMSKNKDVYLEVKDYK